MYTLIRYETEAGNCPVDDFIRKLISDHKEREIADIKTICKLFATYGPNINSIKKGAVKQIEKGLYELRPTGTRIFFIYCVNKRCVLLHGFEKKTQETPESEKRQARKEMTDYRRRFGK